MTKMCHISELKPYLDLEQFLQLFLAFLNANKAFYSLFASWSKLGQKTFLKLGHYPARALRALGLLLADGAPTVGGGKTF